MRKEGRGLTALPSGIGFSDFRKEGEGSRRLRAVAREAGGEGAHGASAWAPLGKQKRKALCQQPGPWAAGLSAPFCSAGF